MSLSQLYSKHTQTPLASITPINNSASNRRYYRLRGEGGETLIGTEGSEKRENEAFVYLANHFSSKGLNVPRVLCAADDGLSYLQEDLGDDSLFKHLGNEDCEELLAESLRRLARLQFEGGKDLDYSKCYPLPEMDRRSVMWDLNYFKYCFLKPFGGEFDESLLEDEFERFADVLLSEKAGPRAFMYRDFQSRNIIIRDGEPWFIDFQGGRRGPVIYDLVSLTYQAKAALDAGLKQRLAEVYYESLCRYSPMSREDFDRALACLALFRCLQTLGAYGFRGRIENKAAFTSSIPYGAANLKGILGSFSYPDSYLIKVLTQLSERLKFPPSGRDDRLTVRVYSFSYKKGLPADYSGNGGGFVFDCRAIHNPGRYDQYKQLTGRDEAVKKFLEDDGEITDFCRNAFALADRSIERYLKRGFTDLMFCFGCTGGQHRSVYAAEAMASHIAENFRDVEVVLIHRELEK